MSASPWPWMEAGSVLVAGRSDAAWGANPVNPFSDNSDAFAVKLAGSGTLLWNTFLGSASYDYGQGIAVDGGGNVLVVGYSLGEWGTPIRPFTPGLNGESEAFVARLSYDLLTISGTVTTGGSGLADVVLSGLPGNPVTNASGDYAATVAPGLDRNGNPDPHGIYLLPGEFKLYQCAVQSDYPLYRDPNSHLHHFRDGAHRRRDPPFRSGPEWSARDPALLTNASGTYTAEVNSGWSGTVTPSLAGYTFCPSKQSYGYVLGNTPNESYTAAWLTYTISGTIKNGTSPLPGVC